MTTGDHIIRLVDEIETVNDNLAVTQRLVELRFHLERWATEVGDYARELDRQRQEIGELNALAGIQAGEIRELRLLADDREAWDGARR